MERISREEMLMDVAAAVARRGTCSRAQVGVVFAREGRILVTGYNGAPRGLPHCTHESFTVDNRSESYHPLPKWLEQFVESDQHFEGYPRDGSTWYWDGQSISNSPGCTVVEHAERNAIAFAAAEGIALRGSDVYCTHAPCLDCARALLGAGIQSITYRIPYRLTSGAQLLTSQGIQVVDLSASV